MSRWKLVGNPDLLAPLSLNPTGEPLVDPISIDGWGGYQAERRELLSPIADNRIDDVALLTGDVHMFMANDLMLGGRSVATEYMGGSIRLARLPEALVDVAAVIRLANPHVRYVEGAKHGWAIARVDPDELRIEFRAGATARQACAAEHPAGVVRPTARPEPRRAGRQRARSATTSTGPDPANDPAPQGSAPGRPPRAGRAGRQGRPDAARDDRRAARRAPGPPPAGPWRRWDRRAGGRR